MFLLKSDLNFKQRFHRYALLLGSIGWGISFAFTFSNWETSTQHLNRMGADEITYQPLLDYWLKMASSVFGCIGLMFLICFLKPKKYLVVSNLLAWMSLFVGTCLLISSFENGLQYESHPTYIADITFCYLVGLTLIMTRNAFARS